MGFAYLGFEPIHEKESLCLTDLVPQVQNYVDKLCAEHNEQSSFAGEDSSYDSDHEAEDQVPPSHPDVCRTESDTLKAEFAEYVSQATGFQPSTHSQDSVTNYTSRVEFGLKLGYPEHLVQIALQKLGPDPGQNELLEELVKLGAQTPQQQELGLEFGEASACEGTKAEESQDQPPLRPIVIDGSNVAMSHGNKEIFSCRGIKICVDWFRSRGHKNITVFVPKWRKETSRPDHPIKDQEILLELEKDRFLVFTPSRLVGGKRMVCYDDRYILKLAAEIDGIVVSNDNYRDLIQESPEFRKVVEEKILMYSFVNDRFMPPDDPLGRSGPTLDMFLRLPRSNDLPLPCPYGKKCTYGNKCKFHHPERGLQPHKSVTDRLVEYAQKQLQARGSRDSSPGNQLKGKSLSLPLPTTSSENESKQPTIPKKNPLVRTKSNVPSYNLSTETDSTSNSSVSKSKSVENVTENRPNQHFTKYQPQISPSYEHNMWTHKSGHKSTLKNISKPEVSSDYDNSVNLHRKLQRQLTLNPLCDPRLFHMRQQYMSSLPSSNSTVVPRNPSEASYKPNVPPWESQTGLHQNVTRIASAPDAYRAWPANVQFHPNKHIQRSSSTSDPQLNLCVQVCDNNFIQESCDSPVWPSGQNQPMIWSQQQQHNTCLSTHTPINSSSENARLKLHYHLAAIFPEEQVQKAMQLYPDETNPQKICAAILAMIQKP